MLPMFKAIPQVKFCKAVEDRRFFFHIFCRHKIGSFEYSLDLWEEVEVAGSEVWRVGWVFKHSDVFISKILLHRQCVVGWHIVLVLNPPVSQNSGRFLLTRSHNFVKTSM
jgi:hypothetical protein